MRKVRVKVCGITSVDDALLVAQLGVEMIGLNFVPGSPRCIDEPTAGRIAKSLPKGILRIGVFADQPEEEVRRIISAACLDRVQLHGAEPPDYCARMPLPVIKAFRTSPDWDPKDVDAYPDCAILVDGYRPGVPGGTGRLADWKLARRLVEAGHELFLAGGLTPENVAEAVAAVGPAAVDLNSGVESSPGVKDLEKLVWTLGALDAVQPGGSYGRMMS